MRKRDIEAEEQCDGIRTDEEIAEVFGVSRSRVQQVREGAVRKLWRRRIQLLIASGVVTPPSRTPNGGAAGSVGASRSRRSDDEA